MSEHHTLLIVGGGAGGVSVANNMRRQNAKIDIGLIEPSEKHYYQPGFTIVGGGAYTLKQTTRNEKDLIHRSVKWIKDYAESFQPDENSVTLRSGDKVTYDYLVVCPGLQLDWGKISGLKETLGKNNVCSNYSVDHVEYTWTTIQAMQSGTALFTQPPMPIKCAGAPQKIMYLAEDHFRRTGVRDQITVSYRCAGDSIFAVKKYAAALNEICAKRGIDTQFAWKLKAVDASAHEASFEHTKTGEARTEKYDMLHITPPMSAPLVVSSSPLANDAGFVDVDKGTLQHSRYPNVFSLGDSSSCPTSKTAAAVRAQLPVLIFNLSALMNGRSLDEKYDGYTSCPLVTGYGRLILAEFDYDLNPQETFPFDQGKERLSMYLLKKHILPYIYWKGLIAGRKWPWLLPESHLKAF